MIKVFSDFLLFHVESCPERSSEMGRVYISHERPLVLIQPLPPQKSMLFPHCIYSTVVAWLILGFFINQMEINLNTRRLFRLSDEKCNIEMAGSRSLKSKMRSSAYLGNMHLFLQRLVIIITKSGFLHQASLSTKFRWSQWHSVASTLQRTFPKQYNLLTLWIATRYFLPEYFISSILP